MRRHPHLLEISAWPWLERLSRDAGRRITLATVPAQQWDRIAADGFDAVFLMGVWRRSAIGRRIARNDRGLAAAYDRALPGWSEADVVGSPYSIAAYEPDERMGSWLELDEARGELRRRGISLILDFVPNHTAFDHAWIATHPERYVQGTDEDRRRAPAEFRVVQFAGEAVIIACGRDPHYAPWTDVAQLNYFNVDTRSAARATLREIAAHCDGVRCDMAMLVLNDVFERTWRRVLRDRWPAPPHEFWPDTIRALPQFVFLAEVYWNLEGRMLDEGFTFAYDKRLLDGLKAPDRPRRTRDLLSSESPPADRLARFLENHDEPRSAATVSDVLTAAACVLLSGPGMRFMFEGQLDGRRITAPVQLGRWPDEPPDHSVRALYDRALAFAGAGVLHEGDWRLLPIGPAYDGTFENIVEYRWRSVRALAVIAVNLESVASEAHIALAADLGAGAEFDFVDSLTGMTYRRSRKSLLDPGLYVRLEPGQAHLFTVHLSPVQTT